MLKVHITHVHFYSPIPQVSAIDPSSYNMINDCIGLDFQETSQTNFVEEVATKYAGEFSPTENIGLSKMDAYFLYSKIRIKKPKLFIEIGPGESTKISLKALQANQAEGHHYKFITEPYPKQYLRELELDNFSLKVNKV